jgi:putative endonuclease
MTEKWHVYIVECNDGSLYTGITTDIERRIKQHNDGIGSKYTRSRLPVKLVGFIEVENIREALKTEASIKKRKRCEKIEALKMLGGSKLHQETNQ